MTPTKYHEPVTGTEQEQRLHQAFNDMLIRHDANHVICFMCGRHFKNPVPSQYPSSCMICYASYHDGESGRYCMPDVLFHAAGKMGVVFVNGSVHDKARVRKKDKRQIMALRLFGYVVHVIKNDAIDNATVSTLRAIVQGFYAATDNAMLYKHMYAGEQELVGFDEPGRPPSLQ